MMTPPPSPCCRCQRGAAIRGETRLASGTRRDILYVTAPQRQIGGVARQQTVQYTSGQPACSDTTVSWRRPRTAVAYLFVVANLHCRVDALRNVVDQDPRALYVRPFWFVYLYRSLQLAQQQLIPRDALNRHNKKGVQVQPLCPRILAHRIAEISKFGLATLNVHLATKDIGSRLMSTIV